MSGFYYMEMYGRFNIGPGEGGKCTGENLVAVTAVTDSFKMAAAFAGNRTGGAVVQTNAHTVDSNV